MATRRKRRRVAAALGLLLAAAGASAAGVYKWVDENGKVHYGDRPPTAVDSKAVDVERPSAPDTAAPDEAQRVERRRQLLRAFEEERAEREAKREREREARAKEKERLRECAFAREDLERLHTATYIYDYDHSGQRRILSDEERAEYVRRFESEVKRYCK